METTNPYLPTDDELIRLYNHANVEKHSALMNKDFYTYEMFDQLVLLLNNYKANKLKDEEILYLREALAYTE